MLKISDFIDICRMTQEEVKEHMQDYLTKNNYNVINEDGFLYAKGDVPVLLVAHMDTVHKEKCSQVNILEGRISSPQGIGGDDRCGIYIIMNIVNELHCSVLLCEDEEIGGVGARAFTKSNYIDDLDVNYMIEFDRKGNEDAVFYHGDNKDFMKFVRENTYFTVSAGSFSDISVLMPAAKLSAVNLSSGYYNAHTTAEYVVYDEMMDTAEAAKELIKAECDGPFEYVAREFKYTAPKYKTPLPSFQDNFLDWPSESSIDKYAQMAVDDTDIELEVMVADEDYTEVAIYVSGRTKADCWMKFFLENPNVCFNDIISHSWS